MGVFRTSFNGLANQSLYFLGQNSFNIQKIQETLASGKSINRVSDDPIQSVRMLDLTQTLNVDKQYVRNMQTALTEIDLADTAINSSLDIIHRAKELATQGATTGNDQNNLNAIAVEVEELLKQLVQVGNTQLGDKYLFGGKQTGTAPFSTSANDITYNGNDPSTAWQRQVEVSENVTLDINLNGETLFGEVQVTATGPPPTFSAGSTGLFRTLRNLELNLSDGDQDEVRLRLDELDTQLNSVLNEQTRLGSVRNRIDRTQAMVEEREIFLSEQYSNIQDVNLPELLTKLNAAENTFQMSLSTTARVIQPSLMQFLG